MKLHILGHDRVNTPFSPRKGREDFFGGNFYGINYIKSSAIRSGPKTPLPWGSGKLLLMLHILKMWLMVRCLYKIQFDESIKHILEYKRPKKKDNQTDAALAFGIALKANEPPRVMRIDLAAHEIFNKNKVKNDEGKEVVPVSDATKYVYERQVVIDNCIGAGFIATDESRLYVYLTDKGAQFQTFSYLVDYVRKELGPAYAWLIGLSTSLTVGVLGTLLGKSSLNFLSKLF